MLVTLSITEAEFVNMSMVRHNIVWVKKLLTNMNIPIAKILIIGTDSRNALIAAESDCINLSTRHTDVRYK
jgi:hypothetical protein